MIHILECWSDRLLFYLKDCVKESLAVWVWVFFFACDLWLVTKEYTALGMQIRSQHRLRSVLKTAFHLVTGDFTAYVTTASRDGVSLDHQPAGGPSATTLSRSRFKLDLFLMLTRQHQWRQWLMAHPQHPQPNVLQHADSNPDPDPDVSQQSGLQHPLPQSQSESQSDSYPKFGTRRTSSRIVSIGAFACI